ncbi:Cadmium resistance transporter [Labilithrix luteola]|uniref:Cadmium resistance transporter n=1 Tax=Labilithrix luteola TaxID=1391654 RepID=A0A0K1PRU3_9BACT|nr:cadmium resistance transporter [Labilithrix luteola]AKU96255.1 Cadmium resistance transporter [Labilithrix luteola]
MITAAELLNTLVKAVVVFVSTNVDDIVLLSVLFADPKLRPRSIVAGQFLGIGALVVVSVVAGSLAVAFPAGWTSLLGAVPLLLGISKGVDYVRSRGLTDDTEEGSATADKLRQGSQVLAVVGVTLANGGDNLGVYIPLFAAERRAIGVYAAVFAALTAAWCGLGFKLVNNRAFGSKLRRYGNVALPIVLILLGIHILAGARALF